MKSGAAVIGMVLVLGMVASLSLGFANAASVGSPAPTTTGTKACAQGYSPITGTNEGLYCYERCLSTTGSGDYTLNGYLVSYNPVYFCVNNYLPCICAGWSKQVLKKVGQVYSS